MKKLTAILLCLVITLGLFAGCSKDGGGGGGGATGSGSNGKPVLTIGIPLKTTVIDYATNGFTKWLEEELDCEIKIQEFATGGNDYKIQLSGMTLKEEKLPDILWNFTSLSGSLWDMYGQEGYLVNLKPYLEDREGASKIWWEHLEGVDETYIANVMKRCEDDYGDIYVLPRIETSIVDTMDYIVSINQTWLDACGLEQPTNIDEFYNVLKTFKEKMCADKAGYYPLIGGGPSMLSGDVTNWIINMFLYFNDATYFGLSEDGTTLTTPFTSDKYREALAFCKKLVDEGLLTYELQTSEVKSLVNPADGTPRVGMFVGHPTLDYVEDDPSIDHFVPLSNYWGCAVRTENVNELSAAITTDCADPDLAFKLLMLASSQEGGYRLRYGVLGEDWEWADEGAKSFLGLDCTVKVLNPTLSVSTQNASWINGPGILLYAENETAQYPDESGWVLKKAGIIAGVYDAFCKAEAQNNPRYICPIMVLSEEQSLENTTERENTRSMIYVMRDTFIKSTSNDTVLGGSRADINNDAHWQAYLDALEKEGLQLWKDQMQAIYDAEYKNLVLGN